MMGSWGVWGSGAEKGRCVVVLVSGCGVEWVMWVLVVRFCVCLWWCGWCCGGVVVGVVGDGGSAGCVHACPKWQTSAGTVPAPAIFEHPQLLLLALMHRCFCAPPAILMRRHCSLPARHAPLPTVQSPARFGHRALPHLYPALSAVCQLHRQLKKAADGVKSISMSAAECNGSTHRLQPANPHATSPTPSRPITPQASIPHTLNPQNPTPHNTHTTSDPPAHNPNAYAHRCKGARPCALTARLVVGLDDAFACVGWVHGINLLVGKFHRWHASCFA